MYDEIIYQCPVVLIIEIQPFGELSINIDDEVGWMIPDALRDILIKECNQAFSDEFPEFDEPLKRTIKTLKTSLTREDCEREGLEDLEE